MYIKFNFVEYLGDLDNVARVIWRGGDSLQESLPLISATITGDASPTSKAPCYHHPIETNDSDAIQQVAALRSQLREAKVPANAQFLITKVKNRRHIAFSAR